MGTQAALNLALLLACACAVARDPYDARLERAQRLAGNEEVDAAMKELQAAATEIPERVEAFIALGKLLMGAGKLKAAQQALESALQAYRLNPSANGASVGASVETGFSSSTPSALWANVATLRYQTGDYSGAANACEEGLKLQPDHARCHYIYAVSHLTGGDWSKAEARVESSLRAAIKLFGTDEEKGGASFALGSLHYRKGELEKANKAYEAAVRMAPTNVEALMRLGETHSRLGEHRQAMLAYQRAERQQPGAAEPGIQVGNALRRLSQLDGALKQYRKVLGYTSLERSDKAEAKFQEGSVLEMQSKKKQAAAAYKEAIESNPSHSRALNNLASIHMAKNRGKEAVSFYRRAIAADPHMYEAYNNLGGQLIQDGEAEEAVKLLSFALKIEATEPQLLFNLGIALRKVGRSSEAIPYMRQALRYSPQNKDFYWELARTYHWEGESALALAVLDGMTRTLRTGWDGIAAAPEVYVHEKSPFLNFYQAQPVVQQQTGSANGVILYLCCGDQEELKELHFALKTLSRCFTSRYSYPVIIFHDMLTSNNETTLREAYNNTSSLRFEPITFEFPASMPEEARKAVPDKLFLAGHAWGKGYRHMSRFFSHDIFYHEALAGFDYYLRLDADSVLLDGVQEDLFARMQRKGKVYGYMVVTQEDASVVKGLWNVTKQYIDSKGLVPKSLGRHLTSTGEWNRNMFYTNFEISRLDFWRSSEYRDFFAHIDESMGIYMHRWGDAPIHLLAVSLFLAQDKLETFEDVPYWHQYYVNMPKARSGEHAHAEL